MQIDFQKVAKEILPRARYLVESWFPNGKLVGKEWVVGSIHGEPGSSLKANLETGKWAEFNGGLRGRDLISLYAAKSGLSQPEAAKEIMSQVGMIQSTPTQVEPPQPSADVIAIKNIDPANVKSFDFVKPNIGVLNGVYKYLDQNSKLIMVVARYDTKDGGKEFRPYIPTVHGWKSTFPSPRPIYGLNILGTDKSKKIIITEGEKACDAARLLCPDHIVLTWPGGSNATGKVDLSPIYDFEDVTLWPDADEAGIKAMENVAEILKAKVGKIRTIRPDRNSGWDAHDALTGGMTTAEWELWSSTLAKETSMPAPATLELAPVKKQMPAITGMMKDFIDYLNKGSYSENTEIYLGAALAWLSMITANRWAVKTKAYTTPANLMLWGVMPSGTGKNAPQKLLSELFHEHDVLGGNSYTSSAALLMRLKNIHKRKHGQSEETGELLRKGRRENLIVMDECHAFFDSATGKESYQRDMINVLNTLFSLSSGFYSGYTSKTNGMNYGKCYNPYFTVIGYTTTGHFKKIKAADILGNGFFERSLVFIKEKKSAFNENPFIDTFTFQKLKAFTDNLMHHNHVNPNSNNDTFVKPELEVVTPVQYRFIEVTPHVEKAISDFQRQNHECEEENSFKNRFPELAIKLAMLHAISDERWEICLEDFNWGMALLEYCYENMVGYTDAMRSGEDIYAAAAKKIRGYFNKRNLRKVLRKEVLQGVRFGKGTGKARFLDEIIEMGYFGAEKLGGETYVLLPQ